LPGKLTATGKATPEAAAKAAAKPGLRRIGAKKRRQEIKVGGRAAEGGWPGEGGDKVTGRWEGARRARLRAVRWRRRQP
jgi:hypothetical protein